MYLLKFCMTTFYARGVGDVASARAPSNSIALGPSSIMLFCSPPLPQNKTNVKTIYVAAERYANATTASCVVSSDDFQCFPAAGPMDSSIHG